MPTSSEKQAAARHQHLFREVNDRVRELVSGEMLDVLCECADPECTQLLHVKADEYDEVRLHATRFLVRPDHTVAGVEEIVAQGDGHVIVEKFGLSGRVAAALSETPAPQ